MLMNIKFPTKEFNEMVQNGSVDKTINRILEESRPESVYFTEQNGQRCAILIVNVEDPSKVPMLAEPWFLHFNASVEFKIAMSLDDLKRSSLEELGRKWSLRPPRHTTRSGHYLR